MLPLKIVIITILVTIVIQPIEGNKREVTVTHVYDQLINDDVASYTDDNGSGLDVLPYSGSGCSVNSKCSDNSIDHILANLTSGSTINITADVRLSSIIPLVGLANVSLIGHNNPTVRCNKLGGLRFISCYNCTIEGINWEECGTRNINYNANYGVVPVLQLYNSSNITIKYCSFLHSVGQAIVLSGVSGDVNINYCNFLYNNQYEGHGAAVYYSSIFNLNYSYPVNFAIADCKFSNNEGAKSIVYFAGQSSTKLYEHLCLQNSNFYHNKGVPIYLSNQNVYISGKIEFYKNVAENGGAMLIGNYSNVIFHQCAQVLFSNNKANSNGGAIFLDNHSSVLFTDDCALSSYNLNHLGTLKDTQHFEKPFTMVTFVDNRADQAGGAIFASNSNIIFRKSAAVVFTKNKASSNDGGGAICAKSCNLQFEEYSAVTFSGNEGAVIIHQYSSITFKGNSTVTFSANIVGSDGGAVQVKNHSIVKFTESSTVKFHNNKAKSKSGNNRGGALYIITYSLVTFEENSLVTFDGNTAYSYGGSVYISNFSNIIFEGNSNVNFISNKVLNSGGAVYISNFSNIIFEGNSNVNFIGNKAVKSGGAVYMHQYSVAKCEGNATITFSKSLVGENGGALYIEYHSNIMFDENSTVIFKKYNRALSMGGAMFIVHYSYILFQGNSIVTFDDNIAASDGGALYVHYYTAVIFEGSSTVTFSNNAIASNNGGALSVRHNSAVRFNENSTVTFYGSAADRGGAVYIDDHSNITFKGSSVVTFMNNAADSGGAMHINDHSNIKFKGNSMVTFVSNGADYGGAVYIFEISNLTFEGDSMVTFNRNKASHNGGAVYIQRNSTVTGDPDNHDWNIDSTHTSNITFTGNSSVIFNNNSATSGSDLYIYQYCIVKFEGNSTVTFNVTVTGGAVHIDGYSLVTFKDNSTVTFDDGRADNNGGAMYIDNYCYIAFKGNCKMTFAKNRVGNDGGAVYISLSTVIFEEYSTMIFNNNVAGINGGAIQIDYGSTVIFDDNSMVTFDNNIAGYNGGAVSIDDSSNVVYKGNCTMTLNNNKAGNNGGAMSIDYGSIVRFEKQSSLRFSNNAAEGNGGAVCIDDYSSVVLKENSMMRLSDNFGINGGATSIGHGSNLTFQGTITVEFIQNMGSNNGGAVHSFSSEFIILNGTPNVFFYNNVANKGGAVFTKSSNIMFTGNSYVEFISNQATQDGGAIYLSDQSNLTLINNNSKFYHNNAKDYGGAIYAQFKNSTITFNASYIYFKGNHAGTSKKSVYINVPKSCNKSCLFNRIGGISGQNSLPIATSPSKLILYDPAKCANGNNIQCDTYYINNIMLGQEIAFDACVLDDYDQPAETTQFSVTGLNQQHYNISGSKYISISCNRTTQGIRIIGNLSPNNSYNFTMKISLYVVRNSESKIISVALIIELSQCHPGFWYYNSSRKCECYETKNIISCSNSTTTIKRGYWFGFVTEKPTTAFCPINYCNFTCCEISNGIYHLWPVRTNQCMLHRSGPACGNCEKGFTLPFDSSECVEIDRCTIGQTALVTTLSLLYWIAVVVVVFVMTYFKVPIGCFYGITYYYSIVDILLSQDYYISNQLYTTISIMSSLAKLTPRFLGQLCLVKHMSGIDQQFIHYVHPAVVSLILVMIRTIARRSHKFSIFISRGIIPCICFLLLLSYTSVVSTSLLLMRSLIFMNVDKVYTYLSPDIEYFHGRHIAYAIVAAICTIVIAISLPLLLSLEPYLSSKFNFVKIKPLLDQFQESYKDKYRCFAAYYMICRIIIIVLFVARINDDFTTQYLLISVCALMALIHLIARPYKNPMYNIYDGVVLQLIVIISTLPTVRYFDGDSNASLLVVITYLLIIFPLVSFITMHLLIHKKKIRNVIQNFIKHNCLERCVQNNNASSADDMEVPINEISHTVENRTRRNITCTVVKPPSNIRESFLEVLNEIEDLNDM